MQDPRDIKDVTIEEVNHNDIFCWACDRLSLSYFLPGLKTLLLNHENRTSIIYSAYMWVNTIWCYANLTDTSKDILGSTTIRTYLQLSVTQIGYLLYVGLFSKYYMV